MWDRPDILNGVASALFAAALVMIAYATIHYSVRLPVFPLREVRMHVAPRHVTQAQIEAIVRGEIEGNFFTVNLPRVRAAFERLPWVRKVDLRRQWPDHLEVSLEEHVPLARWGGDALVNTHGEVFTAAYDGKLLTFVGARESLKEITIQYEFFRRNLAAVGLMPVQIQVSPRRAWQVRADNGLTIDLGREDIEPRLERFVGAYQRTVGRLQRRIDHVDLRYSNGFAVRISELRGELRNSVRGRAGRGEVKSEKKDE
jgi:cell division protein FtsQ